MTEVFIAVMVLIGVLSLGGRTLERTPAPISVVSSSANAVAIGNEKGSVPCRDEGPHLRDLTVPYASRSTRLSTPGGDCDD